MGITGSFSGGKAAGT